jgi:hypothetical protein
MSNVRILNGFRVPYSQYRAFPAMLAGRLPAALAPYARVKLDELHGDMAGGDPSNAEGFVTKVIAPRGYSPSIFVRHRLREGSVTDKEFAIELLADFAPYYMHPHQLWSSFDLTIRVDLWMPYADASGRDADYVYGRIVCSAVDETYIALLGIEGVEEFSYYDDENASAKWEAREPVWNNMVDDESRTEWHFIPGSIWLHEIAGED